LNEHRWISILENGNPGTLYVNILGLTQK